MSEKPLLGPPAGYCEILDHFTVKKLEEMNKRSKLIPLRPSSAGKCTRALGYEYDAYKNGTVYPIEEIKPALHRLFDFGHSTEYHVLNQFRDAFKLQGDFQIQYKQQKLLFFRLVSGEMIQGSIDAAFISPKHKALIDIKSKGDKFSKFHASKWLEDTESYQKNPFMYEFGVDSFYIDDLAGYLDSDVDPFLAMNFYQLNMYFFDTQEFIRSVGIDHGALIFYSKNNSVMREIRFRPSKEVYERVKLKFETVDKVISEGGSPADLDRDFVLGSASCAFCPFSKSCWGEDSNSKKAFYKTLPGKKWPKDVDRLGKDVETQLLELFKIYENASTLVQQAEIVEDKIVKILLTSKCFKVKISDDQIYEVTKLKTGGVKNGPRYVLRRGKL